MIEEFIQFARFNQGLTEKTCTEYAKDLRHFVSWAQPRGLRWSTITKSTIESYIADESERGMQPETVKKRVTAIRRLFQYMIHSGRISGNPTRFVETPKRVRKLPNTADIASVDAWLKNPTRSEAEREAKALAALIVETGMRLTEALNLRGEDIQGDGSVRITGKGGKQRFVFFGQRTKLYTLPTVKNEGLIFTSGTDRYYRQILFTWAHKFVKGIHPHMLRHTFATEAYNAGTSLKTISILMGHQTLSTTEIYTHVAAAKLQQGIKYPTFN